MHNVIVNNLIEIEKEIQSKIEKIDKLLPVPKIIAVSKTFSINHILPLINFGHQHFGENKVQEAFNKWSDIKIDFTQINLHMIGSLQTNKVKVALQIFDYIHSLDSKKLALKIANEQIKQKKKPKIFIQINIGNEDQKSGINKNNLPDFYKYCKELDLNIVGTMCIPPQTESAKNYFIEMNKINKDLNLKNLSMGMSNDYLKAAQNKATFLRIGTKIFGERD